MVDLTGRQELEQTDEMSGHNPSFAELAAVMKSLQTPVEATGLNKHVSTIVVAATLSIGAWVLVSLNSVQNTLSSVQTSVIFTEKTVGQMRDDIKSVNDKQSSLNADQAALKVRVDALEKYHTFDSQKRGR